MKSFAKKFLSLALAAVLLLGVFPMAAMAANEYKIFFYVEKFTGNPADAVGSMPVNDQTNYDAGDIIVPAELIPVGKALDRERITWGNGDAVDGSEATSKIDGADRNVILHFKDVAPVHVYLYKNEFTANTADIIGTITVNPGTVVTAAMVKAAAPTYENEVLEIEKTTYGNGTEPLGAAVDVDRNVIVHYKNTQPVVTLHSVSVEGTATSVNVKHGERMTNEQFRTLKSAVEIPAGKLMELRIGVHTTFDPSKPVESDLVLTPYFTDDPNYNPNPDGPKEYYTVKLDENWAENGSAGKVYYAPKEIQQNQRVGLLFKTDKNPAGLLPTPTRKDHVFLGWYLEGTNEPWNEETIFMQARNVTLVAKWAPEAQVFIKVFRNGDTKHAIIDQRIYGYPVNDYIECSDLKIGDYYKNGGKPYKFEGWYDRANWRLFLAKDNPQAVPGVYTHDNGGVVILYGMITDSSAPNNSKPDYTNPKTGDESMIIATTAVMLVSAGALAVFFMDRKRRNG